MNPPATAGAGGSRIVGDSGQDRSVTDQARSVLFCTAAEPARRREIAQLGPVIAKPFRLKDIERALAEVAGI